MGSKIIDSLIEWLKDDDTGDVVGYKRKDGTERGIVTTEVNQITGGIEKLTASGRDALSDLRVDHFVGKSAGAVMVDWADASIGTPTSGWTIAKDTSKKFSGKTSLKVTATAGAADTLTCDITIPATFFGGAKRIGFPVCAGDSYISLDPNNPAQLWFNYSASTTNRLLSYAYGAVAPGDWSEGYAFDQDATATGHTTGTMQWAKVAAETVTVVKLVITKRAGMAIDTPCYIGPVITDPIETPMATLSLFMDGQYSGQYTYARQLLQAYGMRASLAFCPYWINDYPTVGAGPYGGTMTEGQLLKMYELGHEIIHHTGLVGPAGANVGWDSTAKFPDGQEYELVKADIQTSQNWLVSKGATRGLGYGVIGFASGMSNTQTLARRQNIANALRDGGMKKIRQLGAYVGSYYGAARESSLFVTPSRMFQAVDTPATITADIDKLILRGGWSGITCHDFALTGATANNVNVADLEAVLDYAASKVAAGVLRVLPFGEAMKELDTVRLPI